MSAGLERVFSGAKHTIGVERISLGARMLEMAELLKSWVRITPGKTHAPLSGVFVNKHSLNEAIRVMEESDQVGDTVILASRVRSTPWLRQ
jgi:hypothetical protein